MFYLIDTAGKVGEKDNHDNIVFKNYYVHLAHKFDSANEAQDTADKLNIERDLLIVVQEA